LFKVKIMKHNRTKGTVAIAMLAIVQSALRFYFALGTTGALGSDIEAQLTTLLENPVTQPMLLLTVPFLLLGAFGMITAAGLLEGRPWGAYGTIALSVVTIIYDAWAIVAIQSTAILGMVLPALFIGYLLLVRRDALSSREVAA
jgi:hypothetical protein